MTYTLVASGTIVAVTDTFEDAERIARVVGPDCLIECPNGLKLEFCMGMYRKVGERTELFKLAWTAEEILAREA